MVKINLIGVRNICLLMVALVNLDATADSVVSLNNDNLQTVLERNEVVFVNFYADWCRFSQILTPIFSEASDKIKAEFPQEGKVVFAKVDCDNEGDIAATYHISKYPTLKLFRNGEILKKEFRGQRVSDKLAEYIRDQLRDSVHEITDLDQFNDVMDKGRRIIAHLAEKDSDVYRMYNKLAGRLRDNCGFHVAFGDVSRKERTTGDNIVFRPPNTRREDHSYSGSLQNYEHLLKWAQEKCIPLVREITFDNAEELTEEGLPFLILFHKLDDTQTVEMFHNEVSRQLATDRSGINCLTADGNQFSHPLHHLGKGVNDLPILAIDSFRHMYLFPHPLTQLGEANLLKQFVLDLHSGKLHREFHHGPDPVETASPPPPQDAVPTQEEQTTQKEDKQPEQPEQPKPKRSQEDQQKKGQRTVPPRTQPPESTFQKLKPSSNRYTIVRDEL